MKIFRCNKNALKWKEIPQLNYKYEWNLPILVNDELSVVVGNSLKDLLPDEIFIIQIPKNDLLEENLFYMESKVVEENSERRIGIIHRELRDYFRELRKSKIEYEALFEDIKNKELITEENYIVRHDQFKSHGYKKIEEDYQLYLPGFEEEIKKEMSTSRIAELFDFEIKYELLEELL